MKQYKVTSETKGKRHSYARLKTDHFSGDYLYKTMIRAVFASSILISSLFMTTVAFDNVPPLDDSITSIVEQNDEPARLCSIDSTAPIIVINEDFKHTSESSILSKEELAKKQAEEEAKRKAAEEEARKKAEEEKKRRDRENSINPNVESANKYSIGDLEFHGIINWSGFKYSFYSQKVLPGSGLRIPGRHVADGFVRDENGYIVLASNYSIPKGTIVPTPFGSAGKVYDRCPECSINWYDVYTR